MTMANREVIQHWVDALESGDYTQSTGQLQVSGGFCCLGVLCHLAEQEGLVQSDGNGTYFSTFDDTDESLVDLPVIVSHWAGLRGSDPVTNVGEGVTFAMLNDGEAYSFSQISDVIREMYLEEKSDAR